MPEKKMNYSCSENVMKIPVQEEGNVYEKSDCRFFISVDIYPNGVYNTNTLQGYMHRRKHNDANALGMLLKLPPTIWASDDDIDDG